MFNGKEVIASQREFCKRLMQRKAAGLKSQSHTSINNLKDSYEHPTESSTSNLTQIKNKNKKDGTLKLEGMRPSSTHKRAIETSTQKFTTNSSGGCSVGVSGLQITFPSLKSNSDIYERRNSFHSKEQIHSHQKNNSYESLYYKKDEKRNSSYEEKKKEGEEFGMMISGLNTVKKN